MTRTRLPAVMPMLALALLASGCGATTVDALAKAQAAATEARKGITSHWDAKCMSAARLCPKPDAASKLSDCPAWLACDSERHRLYQAAAALQLAIRAAVVVASLDPDQGAALVPGLVAQAARLMSDIQKLRED